MSDVTFAFGQSRLTGEQGDAAFGMALADPLQPLESAFALKPEIDHGLPNAIAVVMESTGEGLDRRGNKKDWKKAAFS